eukprot:TRINITY_DN8814_c0_g1_i2.p1 TRINITY_DN8814_c0_g1~~TRINITY_DN8814_c0_g1_i2.p1  ORF type:complete len:2454 (-),score=397.32 TRINITY_DN8814_c0_g1_i2:177-7538(-)
MVGLTRSLACMGSVVASFFEKAVSYSVTAMIPRCWALWTAVLEWLPAALSSGSCDEVWNATGMIQGTTFTCGGRIAYLQSPQGGTMSDTDARIQASFEMIQCSNCWPWERYKQAGDASRSAKRGIAIENSLLTKAALRGVSQVVSWGCNWHYTLEGQPDLQTWDSLEIDFIPMIWGHGTIPPAKAEGLPPGRRALLGFNEPNFPSQSNLDPFTAASHWPKIEKLAADHGITTIVAPSMSYGPSMDPIDWLYQFFAHCVGCKVDGVALHVFSCYGGALKYQLDRYRVFGKPLWITEIACSDPASPERLSAQGQMAYMQEAIPLLEQDPDVLMYAWFSYFKDQWAHPIVNGDNGDAGIVYPNGSLTPLGELYDSFACTNCTDFNLTSPSVTANATVPVLWNDTNLTANTIDLVIPEVFATTTAASTSISETSTSTVGNFAAVGTNNVTSNSTSTAGFVVSTSTTGSSMDSIPTSTREGLAPAPAGNVSDSSATTSSSSAWNGSSVGSVIENDISTTKVTTSSTGTSLSATIAAGTSTSSTTTSTFASMLVADFTERSHTFPDAWDNGRNATGLQSGSATSLTTTTTISATQTSSITAMTASTRVTTSSPSGVYTPKNFTMAAAWNASQEESSSITSATFAATSTATTTTAGTEQTHTKTAPQTTFTTAMLTTVSNSLSTTFTASVTSSSSLWPGPATLRSTAPRTTTFKGSPNATAYSGTTTTTVVANNSSTTYVATATVASFTTTGTASLPPADTSDASGTSTTNYINSSTNTVTALSAFRNDFKITETWRNTDQGTSSITSATSTATSTTTATSAGIPAKLTNTKSASMSTTGMLTTVSNDSSAAFTAFVTSSSSLWPGPTLRSTAVRTTTAKTSPNANARSRTTTTTAVANDSSTTYTAAATVSSATTTLLAPLPSADTGDASVTSTPNYNNSTTSAETATSDQIHVSNVTDTGAWLQNKFAGGFGQELAPDLASAAAGGCWPLSLVFAAILFASAVSSGITTLLHSRRCCSSLRRLLQRSACFHGQASIRRQNSGDAFSEPGGEKVSPMSWRTCLPVSPQPLAKVAPAPSAAPLLPPEAVARWSETSPAAKLGDNCTVPSSISKELADALDGPARAGVNVPADGFAEVKHGAGLPAIARAAVSAGTVSGAMQRHVTCGEQQISIDQQAQFPSGAEECHLPEDRRQRNDESELISTSAAASNVEGLLERMEVHKRENDSEPEERKFILAEAARIASVFNDDLEIEKLRLRRVRKDNGDFRRGQLSDVQVALEQLSEELVAKQDSAEELQVHSHEITSGQTRSSSAWQAACDDLAELWKQLGSETRSAVRETQLMEAETGTPPEHCSPPATAKASLGDSANERQAFLVEASSRIALFEDELQQQQQKLKKRLKIRRHMNDVAPVLKLGRFLEGDRSLQALALEHSNATLACKQGLVNFANHHPKGDLELVGLLGRWESAEKLLTELAHKSEELLPIAEDRMWANVAKARPRSGRMSPEIVEDDDGDHCAMLAEAARRAAVFDEELQKQRQQMKKRRRRPAQELLEQLEREQSEAETQCETARAECRAWGELADLWVQLGRNLRKNKREAESLAAEECPETDHPQEQALGLSAPEQKVPQPTRLSAELTHNQCLCHVGSQTEFVDVLPELQSLLHELAQLPGPVNEELSQEWFQAKVAAAVEDWSCRTWNSHGPGEVAAFGERNAEIQLPAMENNMLCPDAQAELASAPLEADMTTPVKCTPSEETMPASQHHALKSKLQPETQTVPSVSSLPPSVWAGSLSVEASAQEVFPSARSLKTPRPPIPTALSIAQPLEQPELVAPDQILLTSSLDHDESVSQIGEPDITRHGNHVARDRETNKCAVSEDHLCPLPQAEPVPPSVIQHATTPTSRLPFEAPIDLDPEELEANIPRQLSSIMCSTDAASASQHDEPMEMQLPTMAQLEPPKVESVIVTGSTAPRVLQASGSTEETDIAKAAESILLSRLEEDPAPESHLGDLNYLQHAPWTAKPGHSRAAFAAPTRVGPLTTFQLEPACRAAREATPNIGGDRGHSQRDAAGLITAMMPVEDAQLRQQSVSQESVDRASTALTPEAATCMRPRVEGSKKNASAALTSSISSSGEAFAMQHRANKLKSTRLATASATRRRSVSAFQADSMPTVEVQFATSLAAPTPSDSSAPEVLEKASPVQALIARPAAAERQHQNLHAAAQNAVTADPASSSKFDDFMFANTSPSSQPADMTVLAELSQPQGTPRRLSRCATPQLSEGPHGGPARRVGPAEIDLLADRSQPSRSTTPQPSRSITPQAFRTSSPQSSEDSQGGAASRVEPADLAVMAEWSQAWNATPQLLRSTTPQQSRSTTPQQSRSSTPQQSRSTTPQPSRSTSPLPSEDSHGGSAGRIGPAELASMAEQSQRRSTTPQQSGQRLDVPGTGRRRGLPLPSAGRLLLGPVAKSPVSTP